MPDRDDTFLQHIEDLAEREGRYRREAYFFIYAALEYTVQALQRDKTETEERHVTGQELARGIAEFAREQYGPMARMVFEYWGIRETLDFGRIVFSLVDEGLMRKTREDRLEDFQDVYDFEQMFDPKRIQNTPNKIDLERF